VSDDLRAAILAAADAVDGARGELGRLDGAAGDGDHGMTMSIAARNVRKRFEKVPVETPPGDLLRIVAQAIGDVGGAIGPLHSAALTAIAAEFDATAGSSTADVVRLRRTAEAAEAAIVGLGHAAPGDKTVVDALRPLVESLRGSEATSAEFGAALEAAAAAAEGGAATTADMVARVGRASRLGERSRGLPDAGATSLAIIVRALVDASARARAGGG
jgi:dihydroxyacetone kinase-like protein